MVNEKRINELVKIIKYHRDHYYNKTAIISDAEYDIIEDELRELDPNNELLLKIGSSVSVGKHKIKHDPPMGSLTKITYDKDNNGMIITDSISELLAWYDKYHGHKKWSWKLDGIACKLIYKNGKLFSASTRGDGYYGEDITRHASVNHSIPNRIDNNSDVEIRGEFVLLKSYFHKYMKEQGLAKNCRNGAAGALNRDDPSDATINGLKFIGYNVYVDGEEIATETSKCTFISECTKLSYITQEEVNKDDILDTINKMSRERESLDWMTDGIVITLETVSNRESYGYTGLNPKAKIAFKFKPAIAITTILDINRYVGRSGCLTPVAILNPVELDGTTIEKCTLHNEDYINKKNIHIGAEVIIHKGGDIIPQILRVSKPSENPIESKPSKCPSCGAEILWEDPYFVCNNIECDGKLEERIIHYLRTLDIKNIGESTVKQLVENKYVKKISDIYRVTYDDLIKLDKFGERSIEIYKEALESKKELSLDVFIASLGIPALGRTISKMICKKFKTLESLQSLTINQSTELKGIGDIVAGNIVNGLSQHANLISELNNILTIKDIEDVDGNFNDKNFCCTGALNIKRKDLQSLIDKQGGNYTSIKKGLNYLIIGNGAKDAKIEKAKKLGAEILTEQEFLKLMQ